MSPYGDKELFYSLGYRESYCSDIHSPKEEMH
jgi:hypothetical protein